jgi:hypothetical protein
MVAMFCVARCELPKPHDTSTKLKAAYIVYVSYKDIVLVGDS